MIGCKKDIGLSTYYNYIICIDLSIPRYHNGDTSMIMIIMLVHDGITTSFINVIF